MLFTAHICIWYNLQIHFQQSVIFWKTEYVNICFLPHWRQRLLSFKMVTFLLHSTLPALWCVVFMQKCSFTILPILMLHPGSCFLFFQPQSMVRKTRTNIGIFSFKTQCRDILLFRFSALGLFANFLPFHQLSSWKWKTPVTMPFGLR